MKAVYFNGREVRRWQEAGRVVKRMILDPQPAFRPGESGVPERMDDGSWQFKLDQYLTIWDFGGRPPYQEGDCLSVKEAWRRLTNRVGATGPRYDYKADPLPFEELSSLDRDISWRSAVSMPSNATRFFPVVQSVKLCRLQDITEEEAKMAGFSAGRSIVTGGPWGVEDDPEEWTAREAFADDWDESLNGKTPCSWAANPWVWVIELTKIRVGDVCLYAYDKDNQSRAMVEIMRILDDPRGVAEIKFLSVECDDTGNGLFSYLLKTGDTMNASFKYLTPQPK